MRLILWIIAIAASCYALSAFLFPDPAATATVANVVKKPIECLKVSESAIKIKNARVEGQTAFGSYLSCSKHIGQKNGLEQLRMCLSMVKIVNGYDQKQGAFLPYYLQQCGDNKQYLPELVKSN